MTMDKIELKMGICLYNTTRPKTTVNKNKNKSWNCVNFHVMTGLNKPQKNKIKWNKQNNN